MERIIINIHSFIDVITNSSTEIFMLDTEKAVEVIRGIIEEKEKEFPAEYGSYMRANVNEADEWQIKEAFGYVDEEEAIEYLKARGYEVKKTKDAKPYITISMERGYMNPGLRSFIEETFNVVHHTTDG